MEIKITGLKCDNCNYQDDSVQFSQYKNKINYPCPKCGVSLLTKKEYLICKFLISLNYINPLYYLSLLFETKDTVSIKYPKRKL